jgi:hypothetical protein
MSIKAILLYDFLNGSDRMRFVGAVGGGLSRLGLIGRFGTRKANKLAAASVRSEQDMRAGYRGM